jgi:hypothetical protein
MLRLRTIINDEIRYIDLFDDEVITTDYSFAEIQDITAKNSVYSKTFAVPGSKNNNDIFQHYYNFNTSLLDYDIRDAFNAAFEIDGYTIFEGYIRMENVAVTQDEVQYNITFFSNTGKLTSALGDLVLRDLNFSGLAHDYTQANIEQTLYDPDFNTASTNPLVNGEVVYMLANYGYDYNDDKQIISGSTPIIDYRSGTEPGYFDYIGSPLRFYYLKPAIQLKWLYNQIFNEAGFTITSDFFETAYFKRFYLPLTFNTDSLYLNQAVRPEFWWNNDQRSGTSVTLSAYTWTEIGGSSNAVNRVLQRPVIVDNINATQFSSYTFRVPSGGNYSFRLGWAGYNATGQINPFFEEKAEATIYFRQIEFGGNDGTTGRTLFQQTITIPPLQAFQYIYTINLALSNNYNYAVDVELDNAPFSAAVNAAQVQLLDGPRVVIGPVDLGLELPPTEVKQVDFISGINRRLNLVVVPNPEVPNDFIIEPIIDFIGKGEVLDWSQKLDYNSTINIAPTTSVINGTLYFSGEKDEDFGNTEFNKQTNNIYGTQYVQLDLDYKSKNTIFNDGFSNAVDDVLQNVGQPNITIPVYYITREENDEGEPLLFYNARKTIPRIVFRGLNLPAYNVGFWTNTGTTFTNSFYLDNTEVDMFPLYNRFTTYPFGLTGLTHAVNFNKRQRFNPIEYDFSCYEDLYDVYYEDYVQDLSSSDNRILQGDFYIHHEEVAELKGNEKIYLDGSYYRINALKDFDLTKRALTKTELIKLTREYEDHRVRYFYLQNCENPSDIRYGNTDLNYTLYAYVGKRIEIGEDCYTIFKDEYRDNVVYERFETGFQTNSFLPLFYEDCSCATPINSVDVYDELFCSVPQPTPTVSGANPPPLYYILQDCTGERQVLATSLIPYPLGQVVRTQNGGSTCYFVFDYTTIVNTNNIIATFDDCAACAAVAITPTPTATMTQTPTPSAPPCYCVEVSIFNDSEIESPVVYVDCFGETQVELVPAFGYYVDCMCDDSWQIDGRMSATILRTCPGASPVPTATPTRTPSPTPTTFTCVCVSYRVSATMGVTATGSYQDCNGLLTNFSVPAGDTLDVCACQFTISARGGVISILGDCLPTPTPTPLPTSTPTPTPSAGPAFDPDAETYLEQVLFAGGTGITATVSGATNTLFTELKSCGIYSKLTAFYPFLGGVANSTAINAKDPSLYFVQWFGGLTHNMSGVTGNGTNGYGNTLIPNTGFTNNSIHQTIFQNTENTPLDTEEILAGIGSTEPTFQIGTNFTSGSPDGWFYRIGRNAVAVRGTYSGSVADCYTITRNGNNNEVLYKGGVLLNSNAGSSYTNSATLRTPYLFNFNLGGAPYSNGYANQRLAFATWGSGLDATEALCLYNAIIAFNTTLGRVF